MGIGEAYSASNVTFRVLRAYGWGPLLNLGWFTFRSPFTLLNLIVTPLVFTPRLRLPAAQRGLVRRAMRLLQLDPSSTVLDVGCGRGGAAFTIANEHPDTHVTGIDIVAESIATARTLFASTSNLTYCVGDAAHLDVADGSIDRVLCLEAAFHFPDRGAFLAETRRVLRDDGRVVVVDFMVDDNADSRLWETPEAQLVRDIWKFDRFDSLSEYRAHAVAAGFDVVEARDWTAHVTKPIQTLFNLVALLGRRRWGRRVVTAQNSLLRALTREDWAAFDRAAKAHQLLRSHSRYVALVLAPAASPARP